MKNNFKKSLLGKAISLLPVICMLMALVPGVLVSAATYDIQGDNALYAPPVGKKSAVTYKLLADGVEVTDAVLTISGEPAGVSVYNNKVLLDGTTIQAGSFNVTMTSASDPNVTHYETMTINNNRIFWDFKNKVTSLYTLDNKVSSIDNTILAGGTVNDGYLSGTTKFDFRNLWTGLNVTNSKPKYITFEADYTKDTNELTRFYDSSAWKIGWNDTNLKVNDTVTDLELASSGRNNIALSFDYNKKTFGIFANGEKSESRFDLGTANGSTFLRYVYIYVNVTNVAVYSGEPVYDALTLDGAAYVNGSAIASGEHTAKARIDVELAAGETKQLFLAHFLSDGTLNKVTSAKANTTGKNSLIAELDKIGGGYVKVFLWDGNLVPLDEEIPAFFKN